MFKEFLIFNCCVDMKAGMQRETKEEIRLRLKPKNQVRKIIDDIKDDIGVRFDCELERLLSCNGASIHYRTKVNKITIKWLKKLIKIAKSDVVKNKILAYRFDKFVG